MAVNIAITLFICFSWLLSETNSNQIIKVRLDQKSDSQDLISHSHSRSIDNILGIMVEFEPDNDIRTSGDGTFQEDLNINFYNSNNLRCEGFIVDPPPHNRAYFESQIKAVNNYYKSDLIFNSSDSSKIFDTYLGGDFIEDFCYFWPD